MDVELTEAGRNGLQGIPYRIPPEEDDKPTIKKAA